MAQKDQSCSKEEAPSLFVFEESLSNSGAQIDCKQHLNKRCGPVYWSPSPHSLLKSHNTSLDLSTFFFIYLTPYLDQKIIWGYFYAWNFNFKIRNIYFKIRNIYFKIQVMKNKMQDHSLAHQPFDGLLNLKFIRIIKKIIHNTQVRNEN